MPKFEQPPSPSPEEMAEITKSQKETQKKMVGEGAQWKPDKESDPYLEATSEQMNRAKGEMNEELVEKIKLENKEKDDEISRLKKQIELLQKDKDQLDQIKLIIGRAEKNKIEGVDHYEGKSLSDLEEIYSDLYSKINKEGIKGIKSFTKKEFDQKYGDRKPFYSRRLDEEFLGPARLKITTENEGLRAQWRRTDIDFLDKILEIQGSDDKEFVYVDGITYIVEKNSALDSV